MTNKEIKYEYKRLGDMIVKSHREISILQDLCKHKSFSIKTFSPRIGMYIKECTLCDYCGKVLKTPFDDIF